MIEITLALIAATVIVAAHFRTLANYSAGRSAKKSTAVFCGGLVLMAAAALIAIF